MRANSEGLQPSLAANTKQDRGERRVGAKHESRGEGVRVGEVLAGCCPTVRAATGLCAVVLQTCSAQCGSAGGDFTAQRHHETAHCSTTSCHNFYCRKSAVRRACPVRPVSRDSTGPIGLAATVPTHSVPHGQVWRCGKPTRILNALRSTYVPGRFPPLCPTNQATLSWLRHHHILVNFLISPESRLLATGLHTSRALAAPGMPFQRGFLWSIDPTSSLRRVPGTQAISLAPPGQQVGWSKSGVQAPWALRPFQGQQNGAAVWL